MSGQEIAPSGRQTVVDDRLDGRSSTGSTAMNSPPEHEILERLARLRQGPVTLVYGAKDEEHSGAVVIRNKLVELSRTAGGARAGTISSFFGYRAPPLSVLSRILDLRTSAGLPRPSSLGSISGIL